MVWLQTQMRCHFDHQNFQQRKVLRWSNTANRMADDNETAPSSPPLPKRGAYSIDFDALDEMSDPFAPKKALGSSPPIKAAAPISYDNLDDIDDPFKPRSALSNSPGGSKADPPPPANESDNMEDPFKSKSKVASSPPGSPKVIAQNNNVKEVGFSEDSQGDVSPKVPVDADSVPKADSLPVEEQKKQEVTPKKKKIMKKPKVQSKFKPPKNIKKPQDSEDIQIFMPDPVNDETKPQPETEPPAQTEVKSEDKPAEVIQPPAIEPEPVPDPVNNLPDVVTANESAKEKKVSKGSESAEDVPQDAAPDALASSMESDQPFLDREGSEEPEHANEGFATAAEAIDGAIDTDLMDRSEDPEEKVIVQENDSLLSKFDPLIETPEGKSSKQSTSSREHVHHSKSDHDLLMSSPAVLQPDSSKHPAARALEAEQAGGNLKVAEQKNESSSEESQFFDAYEYPPTAPQSKVCQKSSAMETSQNAKEDGDGKGTVVQLVQDSDKGQVLRYSQTDWNKLKQEQELNFQTSLLNKERDWSLLLGDRDKKISGLEDANRKLKHTNEDMRMVVTEFEKTISQLQAEKEKTRTDSSKSLQSVEHERDQALEDLQSVESAFSDLHRRYEKSKTIIEGFKRNEEQLKLCVSDLQEKLKKSDAKMQSLKSQAEEKLDRANEDIEKIKKTTKQDIIRLEAALKKAELRISGLEDSLQNKEKENQELTAICDELIAKVGS
ncbi:transforming acidic coiled-coil-containing protein 1 [Aplysia californica]|uniref:Transforming acidic coiled-coil-containing protein 1 n=1 Tax=Aplysia californica TaxID=6500 RepID=A0ABM1A0C0_APLCA|nr:transforming acidic coiled-coil-containing protein 1 [Aplysia californica]